MKKKQIKLLLVVPYPIEGPSARYRIHQFLNYFKEQDFFCTITESMSKTTYQKRANSVDLTFIDYLSLFHKLVARLRLLIFSNYDVLIIHRELSIAFRSVFHHKIFLSLFKKPIIFDFDDAVFTEYSIEQILKQCTIVRCGNQYLAEFSQKITTGQVFINPTVVDVNHYTPKRAINNSVINIRIGWIGTQSTYRRYLEPIIRQIAEVCLRHGATFYVICANSVQQSVLESGSKFIEWQLDTELEHLQSFDIGIMPLFDDEYTRGKCAFKLIEYGAVGIPSVASPVGANTEVIVHGKTGFLVEKSDDWDVYLTELITNPELRLKMGLAARQRIVDHFSLEKESVEFIRQIRSVVKDDMYED